MPLKSTVSRLMLSSMGTALPMRWQYFPNLLAGRRPLQANLAKPKLCRQTSYLIVCSPYLVLSL